MPSIHKSALVPYSAKKMYDLVNDVSSYHLFLPNCKRSTVLSQSDTSMQAEMVLSKAGFEQTLSTQNDLVDGQSITLNLLDGPFDKFKGVWTFTSLSDDACKIELSMEFRFTNKLVEMAFGKIFNSLSKNMVKAFTLRAREVY